MGVYKGRCVGGWRVCRHHHHIHSFIRFSITHSFVITFILSFIVTFILSFIITFILSFIITTNHSFVNSTTTLV